LSCGSLWCALSSRLLDAVPRHVCCGILLWKKIKVLLGNRELAVRRRNISILDVLRVQRFEFPVLVLLLLCILELSHLAEHGNLFDEFLEGSRMDGEAVVAFRLFETSILILLKLLSPVDHYLLELGASQVAEGRILAGRACSFSNRLLQAITKSFAEVREFGLISKGADSGHDLLPVLEIGVVHKVPEVLANNRCEKTQVVWCIRLPLEISSLCLCDALLAAANGNHKGVRETVFLQAHVQGSVEVAEHESTSDLGVGLGL
jgi:hypothetical protein